MKNKFLKFRVKTALIIGAIMLAAFAVPAAADAIAVKAASYGKAQIDNIIQTSQTGRLLAQAGTCKPGVDPGCLNSQGKFGPEPKQPATKTVPNPAPSSTDTDVKMIIAGLLSLILEVLARIIWPIVFLAGALMENDIIFSGAMGLKLHDMWIQMRNIVNLLFVLVLVGAAIYNLTGFASEKFQIKQILPKIILGLVLVNFSYMIATVALDAIGVGTNAVFGLPVTIGTGPTEATTDIVQKNLCAATGYKQESKIGQMTKSVTEKIKGEFCENGEATDELKKFLGDWKPHSAAVIMAVELMNMQDLQKAVLGKELTISSLTINIIFAIVMFLIYGISFVLLFIVLLGRAIIVWLAIVLSPFLMVTYVLPEIGQKGGADELKKVTDQVIQTAIAPIIIGFVLSVGYILMKTLQGAAKVLSASQIDKTLAQNMLSYKTNVSGITDFQGLMIAIGTAGFVWMGVKAATSKAITSKLTDGIMGMAQKGGAWLAKTPFYYSRIFPVGTGKDKKEVSAGALLKTLTEIPREMDREKINEPANEMLNKLFPGRMAGGVRNNPSTAASKLGTAITNNDMDGIKNTFVAGIDGAATQDLAEKTAAAIDKLERDDSSHYNNYSANYGRLLEKANSAKGGDERALREFKDEFNEFQNTDAGKAAKERLNLQKEATPPVAETTKPTMPKKEEIIINNVPNPAAIQQIVDAIKKANPNAKTETQINLAQIKAGELLDETNTDVENAIKTAFENKT